MRAFRAHDQDTPIILFGYYNPVYVYPREAFLDDAKAAGADGLIIVDVPPEADAELCLPAIARGLNFIRLATPTTDDARLPAVLANTSGFLYYVSITGVTGTAEPDVVAVHSHIARIKKSTRLPIAIRPVRAESHRYWCSSRASLRWKKALPLARSSASQRGRVFASSVSLT